MAVSKHVQQVKLVCSFGGDLRASPIGNKLIYCGGETRLIIVNRNIEFDHLLVNLSFECGFCARLKYQLPGEDKDVLVSLTDGEDLENMMLEYDQMCQNSQKTVKIRLFLDVEKTGSNFGSESGSSSFSIPDYLFGLDKEEDYTNLCDDQALEEWKIPREHNGPKSKSGEDQDQGQNLDVTCGGAAMNMLNYYPPADEYEYIIVTQPLVSTAVYWVM